MKLFKKTITIITLVVSLASCSNVNEIIENKNHNINDIYIRNQKINGDRKIKNVIMFIGDGMGVNHVDAGGIYKGEPLVFDVTNDKWAYHAYSNTDSLTSAGFTLDETKSLLRPEENPSLYDGTPSPYDPSVNLGASGNITTYTDSAAGGTALATGRKTTNSRIGMDYNVQYKNGKPNYIYIGGRVGYTSFDYDVDAPSLHDPIWGDEAAMQLKNMPCQAIWAEAVCGVRAEMFKNFYMGWSLRYKYPIYNGPISNGGPWYIPGYGAGKAGTLGATYAITYYFKL